MLEVKKRKEITLDGNTLALLKIQAEKEGRNLKNYMEHILRKKANEFKLTDAYKIMMDTMLDKHDKDKLNYINEQDFRKITARK